MPAPYQQFSASPWLIDDDRLPAQEGFVIYGSRRRISTEIEPLVGYIDSYADEQHELRSSKTEYPLESGATVSDHLVTLPKRLQFTGFTSDLVVPRDSRIRDHTTRAEEAWQRVIELQESRQLVSVTTGFGSYENMVVMRAIAHVNDRSGRSLRFTLEMEEMQLRELTGSGQAQTYSIVSHPGEIVNVGTGVPVDLDVDYVTVHQQQPFNQRWAEIEDNNQVAQFLIDVWRTINPPVIEVPAYVEPANVETFVANEKASNRIPQDTRVIIRYHGDKAAFRRYIESTRMS